MRHALILSIVLTAFAGAAQAQSARPARAPADGQAAGLRYLTWAGKAAPDRAIPASPASSASPPPAAAARTAPPRVIPHAGAVPVALAVPTPAPVRDSLTPANAWMRPAVDRVVDAPPPRPVPAPAPPAAMASSPAAAADPMAPRRDAAIFRIAAPASAPTGESAPAPAQPSAAANGVPARYYSLHRQNGRRPDAIAMPAPVYLDALPIELERAPQSEDLAEPPAAPAVLRDSNGRVRPAPPTMNDDAQ